MITNLQLPPIQTIGFSGESGEATITVHAPTSAVTLYLPYSKDIERHALEENLLFS